MAEAVPVEQPIFMEVSTDPPQYLTDNGATGASTSVEVKLEREDLQEKTDVTEKKEQQSTAKKKSKKKCSAIGERFKCPECNRYSAETEEQLQRHVRKVHRGQNPFQCYMCDYSTYNKPLFEEHIRIHKGIKPFKCAHCPYRSASRKNTVKHERVHRADNPLKCPACPFLGKHARSFRRHMLQHDKDSAETTEDGVKKEEEPKQKSEYVCEICETDFACYKTLAGHQRNSRKCEECDIVLCSKSSYKQHLSSVHARAAPGAHVYRCAACGWRGTHAPRALLHLLHHPAAPDPALDASVLRAAGLLP